MKMTFATPIFAFLRSSKLTGKEPPPQPRVAKICALAFLLATCVAILAAPEQAIDPATIKDKASISLGKQVKVKFTAEGDRLVQPNADQRTGDLSRLLGIKLEVTTDTPFRVQGNPARPFLTVSNGFDRNLSFRGLARLKGSKSYFDISKDLDPVETGEHLVRCWESGSLIEEIVLHQFTLAPKSAK
jgi:hypothetical protein